MTFRAPLTAAALLATASLAAQAQARPMTPEDVAKLEAVGAIAVSTAAASPTPPPACPT